MVNGMAGETIEDLLKRLGTSREGLVVRIVFPLGLP
jgi:hypothetical protein